MARYYVIDATCAEYEDVVLLGYRGELLGIFNKLDSAQALAEQRVAAGGASVLVIDSVEGEQVLECAQSATDDESPPVSHSRPCSTPPHPEVQHGRKQTTG